MAGELGAEVAHGRATLHALQTAVAHGMAECDFTLLYREFDKLHVGQRNLTQVR